MGGCLQNFSLLSLFLEPNAASTKCSVKKCGISPLSLTKIQIFSWNYFQQSSSSWSKNCFCISILRVDIPQSMHYAPIDFMTFIISCVTLVYSIHNYFISTCSCARATSQTKNIIKKDSILSALCNAYREWFERFFEIATIAIFHHKLMRSAKK